MLFFFAADEGVVLEQNRFELPVKNFAVGHCQERLRNAVVHFNEGRLQKTRLFYKIEQRLSEAEIIMLLLF